MLRKHKLLARRYAVAYTILSLGTTDDQIRISSIMLFSDESTFKNNGELNRHNWSDVNSH